MNYELAFNHHAKYIHAQVVGESSAETVVEYMRDVQSESERSDCFRVLIEEKLSGPRLEVIEIFDLVTAGSRSAAGIFEALAYVDKNAGSPDMARFAETVAVNRGIPVAVFTSVEEARNWLDQLETSNRR